MILPRATSWQYSEHAPAFFTGQSGCYCCGAPPPPSQNAYYYGAASGYYRRTLRVSCDCPPMDLPLKLTLTITKNDADCQCMPSTTVGMTYEPVWTQPRGLPGGGICTIRTSYRSDTPISDCDFLIGFPLVASPQNFYAYWNPFAMSAGADSLSTRNCFSLVLARYIDNPDPCTDQMINTTKTVISCSPLNIVYAITLIGRRLHGEDSLCNVSPTHYATLTE